jgi:transposase
VGQFGVGVNTEHPKTALDIEKMCAYLNRRSLSATQDKAKAEVAVQVVERWIMARLRHQQFFSLHALNQAIAVLLEDLNRRPFKKLDGCRRDWSERLEQPALKPLPAHPYEVVSTP